MRVPRLVSDRLVQGALALGTGILAADIVIGWAVGAFDRASRSATLAGIVLNGFLAAIAAISAGVAVYQRSKRNESDEFIRDLAQKIQARRPQGPPLIPDQANYGTPGLTTPQLSEIYIESRGKAQGYYSDAEPHALTVMTNDLRRRSAERALRIEIRLPARWEGG